VLKLASRREVRSGCVGSGCKLPDFGIYINKGHVQ
jgi:hypothetical protein